MHNAALDLMAENISLAGCRRHSGSQGQGSQLAVSKMLCTVQKSKLSLKGKCVLFVQCWKLADWDLVGFCIPENRGIKTWMGRWYLWLTIVHSSYQLRSKNYKRVERSTNVAWSEVRPRYSYHNSASAQCWNHSGTSSGVGRVLIKFCHWQDLLFCAQARARRPFREVTSETIWSRRP